MPPWATDVIELAKLWGPKAGPVAVVVVGAIVWALKWKRRHHLQTLLLMREVGVHMIQNRPPTDNAHRLQQNLIWWDGKVPTSCRRQGQRQGRSLSFGPWGTSISPRSSRRRSRASTRLSIGWRVGEHLDTVPRRRRHRDGDHPKCSMTKHKPVTTRRVVIAANKVAICGNVVYEPSRKSPERQLRNRHRRRS